MVVWYSYSMKEYQKRLIDSVLAQKLKSSGAILLQGPRAVGKTTTALFHAGSSIRLDSSEQVLRQAEIASKSILSGDTPRLIDEWQLAPNIWNTVRHEIDARGIPGQFILTGSAAPSDEESRHTGAGRFARLLLRPMSLFESGDSTGEVDFNCMFSQDSDIGAIGGMTVEEYAQVIVRGGWPALIGQDAEIALESLIDYVENITYVDLRTLDSPPNPIRMAALIRALARNTATEASLEKLSKEAELGVDSVTAQTVRKYLDQLTRVFVLEELPAWRTHIRSSIRMRVKPKWHFIDPSIATAALHVPPKALLSDLETMGFFFESLATRDLRVYAETIGAKVYHYRDSTGLEIDTIIERYDEKWVAAEVKLGGEDAIHEAVANFAKLKNRISDRRLQNLVSCNIITAGENSYTRPDGINIIALGHLKV
jgi:predicted AAA+ superfamily ATPase